MLRFAAPKLSPCAGFVSTCPFQAARGVPPAPAASAARAPSPDLFSAHGLKCLSQSLPLRPREATSAHYFLAHSSADARVHTLSPTQHFPLPCALRHSSSLGHHAMRTLTGSSLVQPGRGTAQVGRGIIQPGSDTVQAAPGMLATTPATRPSSRRAICVPRATSASGPASSASGSRRSSSSSRSSSSGTETWESTLAGVAAARRARRQEEAADQIRKLSELAGEALGVAIKSGPQGALRFVQGAQAVATVGSEWLLQQLQQVQRQQSATQAGNSAAAAAALSSITLPGPRELRKLFEQLGATYIKLGQFIASAPTLFPAAYVEEFQGCLDRTPAVPFERIREIVRTDLGRPIEDVFASIDPTPLASASIAQVHAATLKSTGTEVVVKVVKPGVKDTLNTDLSFIYLAARLVEILQPDLSRTSLVGIVTDIRASMMEEVDMRKEALNMEAFRTYLDAAGLNSVATAPVVYRHASGTQVLTMERLRGVPLTDLQAIRGIVPNPEATLISALNVWFGSLIACESFHADVHAGNLLVLRDGRVGFIDFGIVGRISPVTWGAVSAFLGSVGQADYVTMARALVQMGAAETDVDITSFASDLKQVFEAVQDIDPEVLITATQTAGGGAASVSASVAVDEQQINNLLIKVIGVSENYGLRFPREFGLLLKQLLYFDRYTRLLAPSLNVLDDQRVRIRAPPRGF